MSGGAGFLDTVAGLRDVAARQCGVVARSQLTRLGVTPDAVDHQVRARRWRRTSRDVLVLHRGPLTRAARCWVAVLGAPAGAALGAWTALADIAGGADSLAEIDVARLCRRAGLPEPARQSRRRDSTGRWRYLDVEWRAHGRRLVVEVDGVGHLESRRWYDDLLRDAELGADARTVRLRLPAMAARREPERVLAVVRRHLADLMLAA